MPENMVFCPEGLTERAELAIIGLVSGRGKARAGGSEAFEEKYPAGLAQAPRERNRFSGKAGYFHLGILTAGANTVLRKGAGSRPGTGGSGGRTD